MKVYQRTERNATTKEALKLTDTMEDTLAKLAYQGWAFAGASTWKALLRRGLITANTAPRDPSKGVWCHYMLTDAGREAAGYGRTESGVTTIVSLKDGITEAERAYADRRDVPSMSSYQGHHHLEYRDGRIVDLVLVDAPAEEPKAAPAAPAGRTFTVIYTGGGEPIVHADGCSHNVRDSFQGAHTTVQVTGSLEDVATHVYADMIDEDETLTGEDFVADLNVKPCAR